MQKGIGSMRRAMISSNCCPFSARKPKPLDANLMSAPIFRLFTLGVVTNRDEWVYGESSAEVETKVRTLIDSYEEQRLAGTGGMSPATAIKWTRAVKRDLASGKPYDFDDGRIVVANYRPFVQRSLYFSRRLNEMVYRTPEIFGLGDATAPCVVISDPAAQKPWMALAVNRLPDLHFVGAAAGAVCLPQSTLAATSARQDNITDWALKQFQQHYHPGKGRKPAALNKQAIFHYVYAVLHDPLYRETYAQNLKRDFPRVPLYGSTLAHFEQWAAWGAELMQLHIGYETVAPWPLTRTDTPDTKVRAAGQQPRCVLKSLADEGRIVIDSETVLAGIPPQAWDYRLGNRSALDWVLDQHKEKKPKDPTIREHFNTYRFADHKERVLDLLARVTRVSVDTVRIVAALQAGPR
jgi:predicted helicase